MGRHGTMIIADRGTYNSTVKTVDGKPVILVATQPSRRTERKGKTSYIYHIRGTTDIMYNHNQNHPYWSLMHVPGNTRYYDIFVKAPLTPDEKSWLDLNGYRLV